MIDKAMTAELVAMLRRAAAQADARPPAAALIDVGYELVDVPDEDGYLVNSEYSDQLSRVDITIEWSEPSPRGTFRALTSPPAQPTPPAVRALFRQFTEMTATMRTAAAGMFAALSSNAALRTAVEVETTMLHAQAVGLDADQALRILAEWSNAASAQGRELDYSQVREAMTLRAFTGGDRWVDATAEQLEAALFNHEIRITDWQRMPCHLVAPPSAYRLSGLRLRFRRLPDEAIVYDSGTTGPPLSLRPGEQVPARGYWA